MRISVIIPVYQVAPYIERCLRSVAVQTADLVSGDRLECVVVDDCGTDDSMRRVEALAGELEQAGVEFHIVSHIRNRGQAAARNTGTAAATGEWMFYLDGDDELEPSALAVLAAAAVAADGPDWVQGNYCRVEASGTVREETRYFDPAQPVYADREAVTAGFGRLNFVNVHNKLIRSDFIRKYGLTFCEGITYEDVLWCMEAYPHVTRVATVDAMTYRHHLRAGSIMRSGMTAAKLDSVLRVEQRLAEMPQDMNVGRIAGLLAVFGMKHLYLTRFPHAYRQRWMAALWAAGVPRRVRRSADAVREMLQPLSRLVFGACWLPRWLARGYLRMLLTLYAGFLRLRERRTARIES